MDNDKKIVKFVKKSIKSLKFNIQYMDMHVSSEEQGNELIFNTIAQGKPSAIMRLGSTETNCAYPWMIGREPSDSIMSRGLYLSGIFPADVEHNSEFSKIYLESASNADIMALCNVYQEKSIVKKYCKDAKFIRARSIEPYYFDVPWTRILRGKKVLVVHPFIDTIQKQYAKRELLFQNQDILPKFKNLEFVKAVQSAAGVDSGFKSWKCALEYMCKEIESKDFEIAIIGAGAYAMPLVAYVKSIGKIGVQMSGATQLLFGIKGSRWDEHPIISKLYNDSWVRPSDEETPQQKEKVEGGSYW